MTLEEYFWPKIKKDRSINGCWNWTRGKTAAGYGLFTFQWEKKYAHRTALELATGKPIPKGMLACHHCDNRACCRPSHLFLGSYKMNAQDAVSKGRFTNGERRYGAKLTEAKVIEILRLKREEGFGIYRLKTMFSVSHGVIQRILNGTVWTHIPRTGGVNSTPTPPAI